MQHSTTAEPMAVAAACNTFFEPAAPGQGGVRAHVLHVGDNTPTVCEINRGYSTCEGRFLAEHLQARYPNLIVNSKYYPGEINLEMQFQLNNSSETKLLCTYCPGGLLLNS